jgi:mannose-6-phosphate isomerase
VLAPRAVAPGVDLYAPGVPDFALVRARVADGADASLALRGPAIALAVAGPVMVADPATGEHVVLDAGRAVLAAGVDRLVVSGSGEVFVAEPGE